MNRTKSKEEYQNPYDLGKEDRWKLRGRRNEEKRGRKSFSRRERKSILDISAGITVAEIEWTPSQGHLVSCASAYTKLHE